MTFNDHVNVFKNPEIALKMRNKQKESILYFSNKDKK